MKANPEKITKLLKIARGQIDGILKMVEDDRYCIDISNQIMSTTSLLNKTNREILKAHMGACIKNAFEEGTEEEKEEKINEILSLLDKIN